jgi:hypothetical protein
MSLFLDSRSLTLHPSCHTHKMIIDFFFTNSSFFIIYILAPPICAECLSKVSNFWCSDCRASYCTGCCTNNHKLRVNAQHRPVPIKEKPTEPKRCDKHRDEKLKYWCSCETLICTDCRESKQHKGHTSAPIVDVVADITEKVNIQLARHYLYKIEFYYIVKD